MKEKMYSFEKFFEALEKFNWVTNYSKYVNNYDYNKSIFLINNEAHYDNGFLLLKEESSFSSPISVIYFETYINENQLLEILNYSKEKIQCIVGVNDKVPDIIPFGESQTPQLWDYADGIDTMSFLLEM